MFVTIAMYVLQVSLNLSLWLSVGTSAQWLSRLDGLMGVVGSGLNTCVIDYCIIYSPRKCVLEGNNLHTILL